MKRIFLASFGLVAASLSMGCAALHHAQVGQIDNRSGFVSVPFEVKVSETGVDTREVQAYGRAIGNKGGQAVEGVAAAISLFQQGPRTGQPVYDSRYAERVVYLIHEKCPSGRVTGLMSIRETRKYPVISGEIVKITGYCFKERRPASADAEADQGEM